MDSGLIVVILVVICAIFFLVYKRHMISKLFSLDIASQVNEFEQDIQETAKIAVDKIEIATEDLAILLEQAEETIEELKIRVKIAEEQLYKYSLNDVKNKFTFIAPPTKVAKMEKQSFSEHLSKASNKTALHLDNNEAELEPIEVDDELESMERNVLLKHDKVAKLVKEGKNDNFIAKKLNLSIAEITLMKKMNNN